MMWLLFFAFSNENNTLIIGGAGSGIGGALTKLYSQEGYHVFATHNTSEPDENLPNTQYIRVDLKDKAAVEHISRQVTQKLSLVIYNAGFFGYKSNKAPHLDTDDWLTSFLINSIVPIQLAQSLYKLDLLMPHAKIVIMSSRRAINSINMRDGYTGRYSYRTSKAALNAGAIALSQDLKSITVLMVHPGRVATPMTNYDGIAPIESAKRIKSMIDKATIQDTGSFLDAEKMETHPKSKL